MEEELHAALLANLNLIEANLTEIRAHITKIEAERNWLLQNVKPFKGQPLEASLLVLSAMMAADSAIAAAARKSYAPPLLPDDTP